MKVINAICPPVDLDRYNACKPHVLAQIKRIVRKRERAMLRTALARELPVHLEDLNLQADELRVEKAPLKTDIDNWQRSAKAHGQRPSDRTKRNRKPPRALSSFDAGRLEFRIEGISVASCDHHH
jgi:hypothetical protein